MQAGKYVAIGAQLAHVLSVYVLKTTVRRQRTQGVAVLLDPGRPQQETWRHHGAVSHSMPHALLLALDHDQVVLCKAKLLLCYMHVPGVKSRACQKHAPTVSWLGSQRYRPMGRQFHASCKSS